MPIRRLLRWTLPPLALFALAGWLASTPLAQRAQPTAAPQSAGMVPATGPAAQPPRAAGLDRLSSVQKLVAQKNAEAGQQAEEFVHAGWHIDNAPPPDPKLLALDPSLLKGREAELRQQIATTTASGDQAANLAKIARDAQEAATQVAAVEALGRIRTDEAQQELTDLLHTLPDGTLARREVAPLLRPADLSDPRAAKLALLLDDSALNAVEHKQIAFTLSLVALRDRSQLPAAVLDQLSPAARSLLARTTSLARLDRSNP
ncbi:MAG: hypothetical protein ABR567_23290 [Myxococcales bacterium]|nr:hypothetical protein [Myxococcales bacterium]